MRAHFSRRYHLAAAHRLHAPSLTEAENRDVYGKCNNPHGHGHNYAVTVTFSGEVDALTGMVLNLAELDAFAEQHVLRHFDHSNLNVLDEFAGKVPTTENFAILLHAIFSDFPVARLEQVEVQETGNNRFAYAGRA